MRPVDAKWPTSQGFGEGATAGVRANANPAAGVAYLVYLYGDYQPFGHAGEDIACPIGTPVYAMADGVVLWADWGWKLPGDDTEAGYRQRWYLYKDFPGIVTVIQHPGWIGVYAHLSNNDAAPRGARVAAGQLIGLSGASSGRRAAGVGPHLHVEALIDLSFKTGGGLIYGRTNPEKYFGSINPAGTATSNPKGWEDMDPKELKKLIKDSINEELASARGTNLLRKIVWQIGGQLPGQKLRTMWDRLVRGSEADVKEAATLAALATAVKQLASKQGLNAAEIEAAFKKVLAENVVDVDVTVNGKGA